MLQNEIFEYLIVSALNISSFRLYIVRIRDEDGKMHQMVSYIFEMRTEKRTKCYLTY